MTIHHFRLLLVILICAGAGCASIQPPIGGKRDTTPPKLLSVDPRDSLLNTRVSKVELRFDEYVTVTDVTKEIEISPILKIHPTATAVNKKVVIKIVDSLLEDSTTYSLSFGNAIKDLHEGNIFSKYVYTFSTGSYFDSLSITGRVLNAATGLPDSGTYVILYAASRPDSAIVREKPKYIATVGSDGQFAIKGLPNRRFRLYAIKDLNTNLIYDGGDERVAFYENVIRPDDTSKPPILLRTFREIDTSKHPDTDTTKNKLKASMGPKIATEKDGFTYSVPIDTSNIRNRTVEVIQPVTVSFNKFPATIAANRISLSYDSSGVQVPAAFTTKTDTGNNKFSLLINTTWQQNTVYTLKLLKGFAKDTGGSDANPSKYIFRTKREEDYGKIQLHIPTKYYGHKYVLMVQNEKDTIYSKPVMDTMVNLTFLKPANYSFRIIYDKNENGKWDTGDLFEKIQPEEVFPYYNVITLKAGWENIVDFEEKKKQKFK